MQQLVEESRVAGEIYFPERGPGRGSVNVIAVECSRDEVMARLRKQ